MKRNLSIVAVIAGLFAVALWAAHHVDLAGFLKRLHGE
jgi:hypothetical protein